MYAAPEIILIEEPEPAGYPLRFIDVPAMVLKNRDIMEQLVQDTIKKIYNTYVEYKSKVDVFYVAFSGGKDSVVALDLVQRALPHIFTATARASSSCPTVRLWTRCLRVFRAHSTL